MTEILKASAGSGKTFQLAKKYIDLLMTDKSGEAYKHILAITFTNKATAEMKSRILKELSVLAATPDSSPYIKDITTNHNFSVNDVQKLAERYLNNILHDYSSFSVSTIDKFFQLTLRAFAREVGYFNSYQIELDRESLMKEAVDRILDSISEEDKELLQWINDAMQEEISDGNRFKVEGTMTQTAQKMLFCSVDRSVFKKEKLKTIRKECNEIIKSFEKQVRAEAQAWLPQVKGKVAKRKLSEYICKNAGGAPMPYPGASILKETDPTHFKYLFESRYKVYNTAYIVRSLTYELGFVREYDKALQELMTERNVISLDDSNSLLKRIIGGSDAPFIYEKMGVRYTHFLLDEFQDTSRVQWDNLAPLLSESDSRGGRNLIVGDVKQSIYRFRNSDWKLLDHDVLAQIKDAKVLPAQKENYRSCREVVDFNSKFFKLSSEKLTGMIGRVEGTKPDKIYQDACQEAKKDDSQPGYVHVSFIDKNEGQDVLSAVLESVREEVSRGASLRDIAVLVRKNRQGELVANYLKNNGIDVVSDDSLFLKASTVVNVVTAKMSQMLNEGDTVSNYLLNGINLETPESYTSLPDLAEALLRESKSVLPDVFDSETLFIDGFMDCLLEWSSVNGNDLKAFIEYWNENSPQSNSPEGVDAVTIMTIHKSKGLEFNHVIFPFSETAPFFPESGKSWAWSSVDKDPLEITPEISTSVYPVVFTNDVENSLFEKSYMRERALSAIDTMNMYYVALTRAVCSLHIISKLPSESCVNAFKEDDTDYQFRNPSEILYWFVKGNTDWTSGKPYVYSSPASSETPQIIGYPSIPIGERLTPSTDAAEYFGEDGAVGVDASHRLAGIELHNILSGVNVPEDLDSYRGNEAYEMLRCRVCSHPEWFSSECKSMNEREIISSDGKILRPDRVIFKDGAVKIIDYKFGEHRLKYEMQVREYAGFFREMGYNDVEAFLWYVYEDEVVRV